MSKKFINRTYAPSAIYSQGLTAVISYRWCIVVLIKIEIKIEYNKIKSTRNYFELYLTV